MSVCVCLCRSVSLTPFIYPLCLCPPFSPPLVGMKPGVGACQDPCQGGPGVGDRGDDTLVSLPPKDTPGSPAGSPSELGSPGPRQAATFDLLKMVVSYKRMALFLEPLTDTLELARYLLG